MKIRDCLRLLSTLDPEMELIFWNGAEHRFTERVNFQVSVAADELLVTPLGTFGHATEPVQAEPELAKELKSIGESELFAK